MYDVAIIGGGVVGGLLARELSRYQLSVVILEKEQDVAMGASKANSGIVHAGFDAKPGTLKAKLNVRGCERMPRVAKELGVPYVVCKAHDETHRQVLQKLGADMVVIPEQEQANRLARSLSNPNVLDYIELNLE